LEIVIICSSGLRLADYLWNVPWLGWEESWKENCQVMINLNFFLAECFEKSKLDSDFSHSYSSTSHVENCALTTGQWYKNLIPSHVILDVFDIWKL